MKKISISIIYAYYNTPQELLDSIESIKKAKTSYHYEIIIVNNASNLPQNISTEKSLVTVIQNKVNLGFSKAINQGVKKAKGEYIVIVNPDTIFFKQTIEKMLNKLQKNKKIGVIGPQMLGNAGKILHTISNFPSLPNALFIYSFLSKYFPNNKFYKTFHLAELDKSIPQQVSVISGACMMMEKTLFQKVGGFDEQFFMYFEESDFCYRVKQKGYSIVYYPKAKITHYVGRSSQDKETIQKHFEKSRFLYFKKYYGFLLALLAEVIMRYLTVETIALVSILSISAFLNLFDLSTQMMFIGDFGRDYLAARDMILTRTIPLVGIPSSVVWLHQGPLSIYIIGLSFLLGNFSPVAPAIIYACLGVLATFFVFILSKKLFGRDTAVFASLFYATSPLTVISARMPYHTSAIPLVATVFFLFLTYILKDRKKYYFFLFLFFGFLMEIELSNGIIFLLLFILYVFYKPFMSKKDIYLSIIGFVIGVFPFILYDIHHHFIQTLGFPLWIANRIRLFLGLTTTGNETTYHAGSALVFTWQQICRIIYPQSQIVVLLTVVLLFGFTYTVRTKILHKNLSFIIPILWLTIPLLSFIVHTAPGPAYFPILFPIVSIWMGYVFANLYREYKLFLLVVLCFTVSNGSFILSNNYFLSDTKMVRGMPPADYRFGPIWVVSDDVARFIVHDASGKKMQVNGGGFIRTLKTGTDNYSYLIWWRGGHITNNAKLVYTIYEDKAAVPKSSKVIFTNNVIFVTKYEKK